MKRFVQPNITARQPPARTNDCADKPVDKFDFPFVSCSTLMMVAAMLGVVERGPSTVFLPVIAESVEPCRQHRDFPARVK